MSTKHPMPATGAGGFTLVEILVSLLVLAIGLLGMAGLQVAGLRNGHSAYLRTQAILLAEDIGERMRANPVGVANGNYNNPAATEKVNCLNTTGCSAAEMAQHDAYEWNAALAAQLPLGGGRVCIDSTPDDGTAADPACDGTGSLYAIKVWWDDSRSGAANQLFVTSFQP
jgi:type IV pilus assembly protein PilV